MKRAGVRRSAIIAAIGGLVATGVFAGAAFSISPDTTTDTSVTIDPDSHIWNETDPITNGGYQYLAYWGHTPTHGSDTGAPLKVTRRQLSNNALQTLDFGPTWELTDASDVHNIIRSGVSTSDGRFHLAWTTHNDELNYVYSSAGCLSQANFTNCTWSHTSTQADAAHESDLVTYPFFFTKADGTLFMTYRFGTSETGDQYLNKYNNNGTWTAVGRIMHGYDQDGPCVPSNPLPNGCDYTTGGSYNPDGAGPIPSSSERGPYIWDLQFDPTGRLHAMWNWREDGAFGGVAAQHGAYYAYSDNDGVTWKNSSGTSVATAGSDPIKVTDSGLEVVNLPYNSWFVAYDMALDSHNQPHAVLPVSETVVDDLRNGNLRQKHIWRTTSGTWYSAWVEPSGGNSQTHAAGSLLLDRADNAYFIYRENNLGWSPYNANYFHMEELPVDYFSWQGGDHINVHQYSDVVTAIVNNDHIDTPISTTGNKTFKIRMRNNSDSNDFLIWWTTDAAPSWSNGRKQLFSNVDSLGNPITSGDGSTWKTYTFTITDADWTGNLRDLEINPIFGATFDDDHEVDIDYIRIVNGSGTIAKQWEFNQGVEIVAAEASPTNNWGSWEAGAPLLAGVSDTWFDDLFPIDEERYASGTGDDKVLSFAATEQGAPFTESLVVHDFDILGDDLLKFWNFDVDPQGWAATNHVSGFGYVPDGGTNSITGTITGNDSRVMSADNLKVKLEAAAATVHVRMKNGSAATQAQVCFITDADQTFEAGKCETFPINANSGYTEYTADMSGIAEWDDGETLRRLRIDPAENASSGTFHISRVYIAPS